MGTINWTNLKTEYVTTDITYKKLCDKYKLSMKTLSEHAKAESWVADKRKYCKKLAMETLNKISDKESTKLASLIDSADKMCEVIQKAMEDSEQFNRHIIQTKEKGLMRDDNGEPYMGERWDAEERIYKKVDTKAVRELTSAMKDLAAVIRNLNNLPTMAEEEANAIARGRFELEKKKSDEASNTDKSITIKFADGLDEFAE